MQGFGYLVAAYAVVWVGLFVYLAVVMLRIRGVRTELAAVEELVREQQEKGVSHRVHPRRDEQT
jgi:CcmD family protein